MTEYIHISTSDNRERKRRRRELIAAGVCFALIAVLTWVELKYLGGNSYLFLGLLNLNFILLRVVFFIVARNSVKLLLERRRRVLGSRLRTRLVLAFISLSLIPTMLMFLVSVKFVQTSVDYWFKGQVEESMEQALELGRAFYGSMQERLERRGKNMIDEIKEREYRWGGKGMNTFLGDKYAEYGLSLVGVVTPAGKFQNTHSSARWEKAWPEIAEKVDWESLKEKPRPWSTILSKPDSDLIVGVTPVDEGRSGFLVLGETAGQGVLHRLDQIVRGLDEYKKLKTLKYPWKMTLYLTLGVMTMLIILGAIWFGFRLAKEISAPVQALAAGTERIAKGDLTVRLEDPSDDELGFLVGSFNLMAEDLESSQESEQRAQQRLAQQNQELERRGSYIEAVLDNITSGVISMDDAGRIGTVNKAAERILGVPSAFLIGKKPQVLLSGEFAELMAEAMEQLKGSPASVWSRQVDLPVRDRVIKVLVNIVSLGEMGGGTAGTVVVLEDITELEKMQRLAAWREVARRIAHEIKNPLTPIKLSAQRLQRRYGEAVDERVFNECTDLIVRQVERLQQMVSEFSAYAKIPEAQFKADYLVPLVEEVVAMFRTTHRGIRWDLRIETPVERMVFDHEGLRKVFINLFTNAVEALEGRDDGEVVVTVNHSKDEGVVHISVQDNGPGLSEEDVSRMFEPYFSRKKGGTGLGLAIVRSIVSDHKGSVSVRPNKPGGSVFELVLPVRA
jgi:two-component system nitrogen regulation sensor histidine kinase NtrY